MTSMSRALISPGKYIQGAGVITEIGAHAAKLGSCALVLGGRTALSMCGQQIAASLAAKQLACHQEIFGGVSSRSEIGGMSIDAGKVVAHELKVPVIVVPTIATTNAPCSAMSVIYTDAGELVEYLPLDKNPDCVLVDTTCVAQSPAKFLVAGMGDALATFWEADTCVRSGLANGITGTTWPTLAALALARLTYDTLLESGLQARLAVERKVVTPAVEAIVEANTLTSGLGFENLGHAGAHSVHNGLLTAKSSDRKMHGEIVAFGVLVQLVLEGRPSSAVREVQDFCSSVGLPLCLEDLGISNPSVEEIRQVAQVTCAEGESIHSTWFPVTAAAVEAAIWTADALGTHYKQKPQS
jgi:glycerol dehydrogenase